MKSPEGYRLSMAQLSLHEFMKGRPIIKDEDLRPHHIYMINASRKKIENIDVISLGEDFQRLDIELDRNIDFFLSRHLNILIMWSCDEKCITGGVVSSMPYMKDEFRGRGLGKYFYIANYFLGLNLLNPMEFSEDGYRARRSAHKYIVESAIEYGLSDFVPMSNLVRYKDESPIISDAHDLRMEINQGQESDVVTPGP